MSLDDCKQSLPEFFFQPGDKIAEPYLTELTFNNKWDIYDWRSKAYKAAGNLNMPIKMCIADGIHLTVSTLQENAFASLTLAMENAPQTKIQCHELKNCVDQNHEGFDYECLRVAVNRLVPR